MVAVPEKPSSLPVIVATPLATTVTVPLAVTVATAVFELDQVACVVTSPGEPWESVAVAASRNVTDTGVTVVMILTDGGVTVMLVTRAVQGAFGTSRYGNVATFPLTVEQPVVPGPPGQPQ
jgi:hypothetical protein